jgi:hypothetical protein
LRTGSRHQRRGARPPRLCRPQAAFFVKQAARVHRILPRVRHVRETPLSSGQDKCCLEVIWGRRQRKYFLRNGRGEPSLVGQITCRKEGLAAVSRSNLRYRNYLVVRQDLLTLFYSGFWLSLAMQNVGAMRCRREYGRALVDGLAMSVLGGNADIGHSSPKVRTHLGSGVHRGSRDNVGVCGGGHQLCPLSPAVYCAANCRVNSLSHRSSSAVRPG